MYVSLIGLKVLWEQWQYLRLLYFPPSLCYLALHIENPKWILKWIKWTSNMMKLRSEIFGMNSNVIFYLGLIILIHIIFNLYHFWLGCRRSSNIRQGSSCCFGKKTIKTLGLWTRYAQWNILMNIYLFNISL